MGGVQLQQQPQQQQPQYQQQMSQSLPQQQQQQQQSLQLQPQSVTISNAGNSQMSTPRMEQQSSTETVSERDWRFAFEVAFECETTILIRITILVECYLPIGRD